MPQISVIVPICNAGEYLEECLDSIRCQSMQDIEVLCIDDGSTDGSLSIMKKFAQGDSRFHVMHKENSGYGHSMNVGMDAARGKYISIVESDDWIPTEMLQTLYECAEMNEVDFIKADFFRFVHQTDGTVRKIHNHLAWDKIYYNRVLCPSDETETFRFIMNIWSGIYNTDFIRKNHIRFHETPGASFQDNGFWFQTFALAKRAFFLDKPLYMNRRDNPCSSVNSKEKVFAACVEYDFIHEWIKHNLSGHKRFFYLCSEGRIRNYLFTIDRIGDEFKKDFYKKFREDYLEMKKNREVAETLLPEGWKQRIKGIVENPQEACQKEQKVKNRYMKSLGSYQDIIIYGAGNYAHRVYNKICSIGAGNRIAYFAVTDIKKNPSSLYDIPVVMISSLAREFKENALVIPAVREELLEEVVQKICEEGYCNYTIDRIFFE